MSTTPIEYLNVNELTFRDVPFNELDESWRSTYAVPAAVDDDNEDRPNKPRVPVGVVFAKRSKLRQNIAKALKAEHATDAEAEFSKKSRRKLRDAAIEVIEGYSELKLGQSYGSSIRAMRYRQVAPDMTHVCGSVFRRPSLSDFLADVELSVKRLQPQEQAWFRLYCERMHTPASISLADMNRISGDRFTRTLVVLGWSFVVREVWPIEKYFEVFEHK